MTTPLQRHIDPQRLRRLLVDSVDRYSPSYAEGPVLELYRERLRAAGLRVRDQPVPGPGGERGRGNLIVELGPQPPALLWVGHLDTVEWLDDEPPLARIDGDTLWGLGSSDMKGGCAAIVEALLALHASGRDLARGLQVALVVGEESYGDGAEALLASGAAAPLTLIGEPTGLAPCIEHYGYYEYRLDSHGQRAHAALTEVGANAIHAMLAWLTLTLEQAQQLGAEPPVAFNPRTIQGGADMFVVAEHCEAWLDVHLPPGLDAGPVDALLEACRREAERSHPNCRLAAERIFTADGYRLDPDHPQLAPLKRAFAACGEPWAPRTFRSHSDGNLFLGQGVMPVVCGPGRLEVAHTRQEQVSLAEVEQAAHLYAALIEAACLAP